MHSLLSSQSPTTGLSALNLLCIKDLYTPFTQGELEFFKQSIKSKKQLAEDIKEVRGYMIENEKCYANGTFSKEEYELSVAKLTQLFKTLLYKKETLKTPSLSSTVASGVPTHLVL
jgi:hypothetical protein